MDGLRSRLFPMIDEQQFKLQRQQLQKEQAIYVVQELRKNHTGSLYSFTQRTTPKRTFSHFKKPKQKLTIPVNHQPSQRQISPHLTPPKVELSVQGNFKFQQRTRSNLKTSRNSKIFKIKTEPTEEIREQQKYRSIPYSEQSLGNLINVHKLRELEQDLQYPKKHQERRKVERKGAGGVTNRVDQADYKLERKGILKITSIKGWATEQDENRFFN